MRYLLGLIFFIDATSVSAEARVFEKAKKENEAWADLSEFELIWADQALSKQLYHSWFYHPSDRK